MTLEPAHCRLTHPDGRSAHLQPRVAEVLVALLRAGGGTVTRGELVASCWRGLHVDPDAISRVIVQARWLGEDFSEGSFTVETLPRVGYRLALRPAPKRNDGSGDRQGAPWALLLGLACGLAAWRLLADARRT